ncbi:hypothetical protein PUN28_005718 [Cardiocondyla obscurior]|uniref:Uncharacterized protein n=1 Tax=Cardiocondyla obscurior TaxID=286306 RepID=A0AAW2GA37_9HYME
MRGIISTIRVIFFNLTHSPFRISLGEKRTGIDYLSTETSGKAKKKKKKKKIERKKEKRNKKNWTTSNSASSHIQEREYSAMTVPNIKCKNYRTRGLHDVTEFYSIRHPRVVFAAHNYDRIGLNQGAKCITAALNQRTNPILHCSAIMQDLKLSNES